MAHKDDEISKQTPHILTYVEYGYRWLPLRLALQEFDKLGADTLLMNDTGLLVRIKDNYTWLGWSARVLSEYRLKGFYAASLFKVLQNDIMNGTCVYPTRPKFSVE